MVDVSSYKIVSSFVVDFNVTESYQIREIAAERNMSETEFVQTIVNCGFVEQTGEQPEKRS